ncbi:WD40/YVTN/BNR-like repeat-containing protein, partial [Klebsiella aerogenes]|uniref:WD40/YVTN/BNR-like repeat-containing protein n=1 Tax=Klebsiella aerogenes TaxID=548 RepID=UPI001CBD77A9
TFNQLPSTVKLNGFNAIWDIEHSEIDSQTIFVGTNSYGLYRSTDGGATWSIAYNGGNKQVTDVVCLPNGRVMATMQSNLVVASDSNGKPGTF